VGLEERADDAFIVGLFSLLEAMVDQPMHAIIADLPLEKDIKDALLGRPSPFTPLLTIIRAYESGQWEVLKKRLPELKISSDDTLPELYAKALSFAHEAFSTEGGS